MSVTIDVNPEHVLYGMNEEVSPTLTREVRGGDWDKSTTLDFARFHFYRAFRDVLGGASWQDTDYYRTSVDLIREGKSRWCCYTVRQFDARITKLEEVFTRMRDGGFVDDNPSDSVGVCIARDGTLLFNNGRHRLAMAKLLRLESVPMRVNMVHTDWERFRGSVRAFASSHGGHVYQELLHPDLRDIPHAWGHERWDAIEADLPFRKGTLVDLGANWGYFSQRAERVGFRVTAVERESSALSFLKRLRIAGGHFFEVSSEDVLRMKRTKWDVVLALNLFHHFLKAEHTYQQLVALLGRLDVRVMYFQTHNPNEGQMRNAYRNFGPEDFARFIVEHSCFDDYRYLDYDDGANRRLYRLSRSK